MLTELWRTEMLSLDDLAEMWQVPRSYARDVLVRNERFPPPGSTRKYLRWRREDVERFVRGEE